MPQLLWRHKTELTELARGCFLAGTPILVAGKEGEEKIPIEKVKLFDYVLSSTASSDNSQNASVNIKNHDANNTDPFVSDIQRTIDEYDIAGTEWYEVDFESISEDNICQLALPKTWLIKNKIDNVGDVYFLNIPEQGTIGKHRVAAILPITPSKPPKDVIYSDDYGYYPVTGLFSHNSDNLMKLVVSSCDTLSVTKTHPIYSYDEKDWVPAGDLNIGERISTRDSFVFVEQKIDLSDKAPVFNLQVQNVHNYLVGKQGIIVHNNCIQDFYSIVIDKVLLINSNIAKRLTIKSGTEEVFISAKGLEKIHQKIFYPGFDAETDIFTYKMPIEQAESVFAFETVDLSVAIDNTLPDVIANNKWDTKVYSGKWELIFKQPVNSFEKIKLYHAVPNQ